MLLKDFAEKYANDVGYEPTGVDELVGFVIVNLSETYSKFCENGFVDDSYTCIYSPLYEMVFHKEFHDKFKEVNCDTHTLIAYYLFHQSERCWFFQVVERC